MPVTPPNTVVVTQCLLGETGIGRKKCGTGWGETRRFEVEILVSSAHRSLELDDIAQQETTGRHRRGARSPDI